MKDVCEKCSYLHANSQRCRIMDAGYDLDKIIADNEDFSRQLGLLLANIIEQYRAIDFYKLKYPRLAPYEYPIWYLWWQGADNMPTIPRLCLNSLLRHADPRRVRFIDRHNYRRYIELPDYVLAKVGAKKLTMAQLSDIIRVALLEKYGGFWMDSTILLTDDLANHPELFAGFYTRKCQRDKSRDPKYAWCISFYRWSGFFMGSNIRRNPLFSFVKDAFLAYWHDYDYVADYLMIDYLINLAYENIPFVREEIDSVPINNPCMTLLGELNSGNLEVPFNENAWLELTQDTFFHKLNWKDNIDFDKPGTFYQFLRERYGLYEPGQNAGKEYIGKRNTKNLGI